MKPTASVFVVAGALGGCVSHTANDLIARATFDLNCPRQQLAWQNLDENNTVWGATGCGRRATYVYNAITGQWIMNASMGVAPPAPQSGPPEAGNQQGANP